MKKKLLKPKITKHPLKKKRSYSPYTIIGFAIITLLLVAPLSLVSLDRPYVLGTSVLASDSADLGAKNTFKRTKGIKKDGKSGILNSSPGTLNKGRSKDLGNSPSQNRFSGETFVDCVGTDSAHFQTTLKACKEVNEAS